MHLYPLPTSPRGLAEHRDSNRTQNSGQYLLSKDNRQYSRISGFRSVLPPDSGSAPAFCISDQVLREMMRGLHIAEPLEDT